MTLLRIYYPVWIVFRSEISLEGEEEDGEFVLEGGLEFLCPLIRRGVSSCLDCLECWDINGDSLFVRIYIYIYICICCVDILFTKRYMGDDHVGGSWLIIVMNGNKYTYISL